MEIDKVSEIRRKSSANKDRNRAQSSKQAANESRLELLTRDVDTRRQNMREALSSFAAGNHQLLESMVEHHMNEYEKERQRHQIGRDVETGLAQVVDTPQNQRIDEEAWEATDQGKRQTKEQSKAFVPSHSSTRVGPRKQRFYTSGEQETRSVNKSVTEPVPRHLRPISHNTQNSESHTFGGAGSGSANYSKTEKLFRLAPLKENTPVGDQYQEWVHWISLFKIAAEDAGITDERKLAVKLNLLIGDKTSHVISANKWLPDIDEVELGYSFYKTLVKELEAYFDNKTDKTTVLEIFNSMKQEDKEPAQDWEYRLRQFSLRLKFRDDLQLRNQFIRGLQDKKMMLKFFGEGKPLRELVQEATRLENVSATLMKSSEKNLMEQLKQAVPSGVEVAAVEDRSRRSFRNDRWSGGKREYPPTRGTSRRSSDRYGQGSDRYGRSSEVCKYCGKYSHHDGVCKARDDICRNCKKRGHHAHMCKSKNSSLTIRSLQEDVEMKTKQEVNEVDDLM